MNPTLYCLSLNVACKHETDFSALSRSLGCDVDPFGVVILVSKLPAADFTIVAQETKQGIHRALPGNCYERLGCIHACTIWGATSCYYGWDGYGCCCDGYGHC